MFRFVRRAKVFARYQKRNFNWSGIKAKIEENSMFQRIARPFNVPWIRRTLRVGQVGFISFLIFQTGFQRGIVNYSKDPEKFENEMMNVVLSQNVVKEFRLYGTRTAEYIRVNRIVTRIIASAREFCHQELVKARRTFQEKLANGEKFSKAEVQEAKAEVEFWENANGKMHVKWDVVVSDHDELNAFVTGFCPRKIFVYKGLLTSVKPTDDELALILGHEISHVILGHTDEEIPVQAIMLGVELMFLAMVDPIGIWSFIFDYYVNKARVLMSASFSRSNEMAADELGLEIASNACYDVSHGKEVFKKLSDLDKKTSTSWADTHPASIERYQNLTELSKKYVGNQKLVDKCADLQNAGVLAGLFTIFGH